jgi:thioredoxin-dependent peroxiredoxin
MLKVGQKAPDFEARTTDDRVLKLSSLRGRPVVLYFFPRAFTVGCTLETKRFRDKYEDLKALGAEVVGISVDDLETQCRFAQAQGATFPMVADSDRAITKGYDVLRPLIGSGKRVTYLIDEQGNIEAIFHHELRVTRHVDDVLRALRERRAPAAPAGVL